MSQIARQAHAAHQKFEKSAASLGDAPSVLLAADSPEVVEQLEALDDAVFEAIQGSPKALEELQLLWPRLKDTLGESLLAESCEQYIRFALSVWREPATPGGDRDPLRALSAVEVLCVLFGE